MSSAQSVPFVALSSYDRALGIMHHSPLGEVAHVNTTIKVCWQKKLHCSCQGHRVLPRDIWMESRTAITRKCPVPSTKKANLRFHLQRRKFWSSTYTCNTAPFPRFRTNGWEILLVLSSRKNECHHGIKTPSNMQLVERMGRFGFARLLLAISLRGSSNSRRNALVDNMSYALTSHWRGSCL